jgi:hypothetical protein
MFLFNMNTSFLIRILDPFSFRQDLLALITHKKWSMIYDFNVDLLVITNTVYILKTYRQSKRIQKKDNRFISMIYFKRQFYLMSKWYSWYLYWMLSHDFFEYVVINEWDQKTVRDKKCTMIVIDENQMMMELT